MPDLTALRLDGKTVTADVLNAITDATLTRTIDGASTLTLGINDPKREIVRSRLLANRVTATLDRTVFELVQVRKSGSSLSVVLEDAVVADLRNDKGLLTAKAGTTTVDAFARRLVSGAPGAKLVAFGGQRNLDALQRGSEDDRTEDSWQCLQRLAEERGWRCFCDRGTVYLGPDSWLLGRAKPLEVREHTAGVEDIDWDADKGKRAPEGSFVCTADRWAGTPGTPVLVHEQGLGAGLWLVQETDQSLFSQQLRVGLVRQQPVIPEPKPEPRDDGAPTSMAPAPTGGTVKAGPIGAKGLSWPLSGRLTSGFGSRGGRLHAGIDLAVPIGTPVRAAAAGTVLHAGEAGGYGLAVYLQHAGGIVTRYGHLSRVQVRRGQTVAAGAQVALSGNTGRSTGPHLHFEVRVNGRPVDPASYLPKRG